LDDSITVIRECSWQSKVVANTDEAVGINDSTAVLALAVYCLNTLAVEFVVTGASTQQQQFGLSVCLCDDLTTWRQLIGAAAVGRGAVGIDELMARYVEIFTVEFNGSMTRQQYELYVGFEFDSTAWLKFESTVGEFNDSTTGLQLESTVDALTKGGLIARQHHLE